MYMYVLLFWLLTYAPLTFVLPRRCGVGRVGCVGVQRGREECQQEPCGGGVWRWDSRRGGRELYDGDTNTDQYWYVIITPLFTFTDVPCISWTIHL